MTQKPSSVLLTGKQRDNLTLVFASALNKKKFVGAPTSLGYGKVPRSFAKKYSDHFTSKGKLKKGLTGRDVFKLQRKLQRDGVLEYSSKSPYAQGQEFLRLSKELEGQSEEWSKNRLMLSPRDFLKWQQEQQQTLDPNTKEIEALQGKIDKVQKQLQGFKNVGSPQQTQRLQGLINKFTSQKLKLEDPSGRELRKFRYEKLSEITGNTDTYHTIGNQGPKETSQNKTPDKPKADDIIGGNDQVSDSPPSIDLAA